MAEQPPQWLKNFCNLHGLVITETDPEWWWFRRASDGRFMGNRFKTLPQAKMLELLSEAMERGGYGA